MLAERTFMIDMCCTVLISHP